MTRAESTGGIAAIDFIRGLAWDDVPERVQRHVRVLLRDLAAVSAAARPTPAARVAAAYAAEQHGGDEATLLCDGRRAAAAGAAFANGVLANALDFDDGHRLVKGHPGAIVIPAALAVAERTDAADDDFLAAVAIGYEIGVRAGLDLHARAAEYHASGAWGAVAAAAAAARLLDLHPAQTRHALGLAEYHAPIAPIMRSVADPAMTKDACGWGAYVGVSSALLARAGFTSLAGTFLDHADAGSLARTWRVLEVYVKQFPCCKWTDPAIAAALRLRERRDFRPESIVRVRVRTFAAAAALATGVPETTEEAQYSLVWPVAYALAHGDFTVASVLEPALHDPVARELAARVEIEVDAAMDKPFPARRLAQVTVELRDGSSVAADGTDPPAEGDAVRWEDIVEAKVADVATALASEPFARLVRAAVAQPARASYDAGRRSSASAMT